MVTTRFRTIPNHRGAFSGKVDLATEQEML